MSTAPVIHLNKPAPGLFPEELRGEELELAEARLLFEKQNQPDRTNPEVVADWLSTVIGWSFRIVPIRSKILLRKEEVKLQVVESIVGSDIPLSLAKELVNAKIARYVVAFDHCERIEAHMSRAIEAYRSILSMLKEERARSSYGHQT